MFATSFFSSHFVCVKNADDILECVVVGMDILPAAIEHPGPPTLHDSSVATVRLVVPLLLLEICPTGNNN